MHETVVCALDYRQDVLQAANDNQILKVHHFRGNDCYDGSTGTW